MGQSFLQWNCIIPLRHDRDPRRAAAYRKLAVPLADEPPDAGQALTVRALDHDRPGRLAAAGRRIVFFPGSTIGNFTPPEAKEFLTNTAGQIGPNGGLLIGVDLKKDPATLEAAYNDSQGVTAKFNRNLLTHINRIVGADFEPASFRHCAFYNESAGRIEMHLVSLRDQLVTVAGEQISFRQAESIHTENSYKFSIEEFQQLGRDSGFRPERAWTDAGNLFSVHYMTVADSLSA